MKVCIAAVGRLKPGSGLAAAIRDYEDRLHRCFRFTTVEVAPAGLPDSQAERARKEEGRALARGIPDELELVALTRKGAPWSTDRLARYLQDLGDRGRPGAAFAIGGAHGLSGEFMGRSTHRVSVSAITLPHEMARLVLSEQLYRAGMIHRNHPYHKGK